ncbi:MAG: hypothetical protein AB4080_03015 [Trichodesmium sp.]
MKRREFMTMASSIAGAILLSRTTYGQQKILSSSPKRYISSNGLLDVSLTAGEGRVLLDGQEINRTYAAEPRNRVSRRLL